MIIKASASLRNNYTEISKQCHETGEPIYITKNGEGDLVVMSIEKYEKLLQEINDLNELIIAEEEILKGENNFVDGKEALKMIFGDDYYPSETKDNSKDNGLKVAEESEPYNV